MSESRLPIDKLTECANKCPALAEAYSDLEQALNYKDALIDEANLLMDESYERIVRESPVSNYSADEREQILIQDRAAKGAELNQADVGINLLRGLIRNMIGSCSRPFTFNGEHAGITYCATVCTAKFIYTVGEPISASATIQSTEK